MFRFNLTPSGNGSCRPSCWTAVIAALLALVLQASASAQAPAATSGKAAPPPSPAELEKLVARIALYPDDLVGIILPASTNPLQIVQADRFLQKRKTDPKAPVDPKLDDPIKSLLNYPEVVKMMSTDLDWTTDLGEAVVASQVAVLEAIQAFRRKTYAVGNLKSDPKQVVVVEKEVIKIVPADPQVIYVPQYNPTTVVVYGGYSSWAYYPTPYPVYYYPYPPGAAFATGLVWGAALGAAWNGNHYATHYGGNANITVNKNVNINTANINTANINTANVNRANVNTANINNANINSANVNKANVNTANVNTANLNSGNVNRGSSAGGTQWQPSNQASAGRSTTAAGVGYTPTAATTSYGGAARSTQSGGGSAAFGGYSSGHQAQMDSSRGAASRSTMSAGGGRQGGGGGGGRGRR